VRTERARGSCESKMLSKDRMVDSRRSYMKPESPGHSMQYQHYYSHASSSTALVVEIVRVLRQALEGWFP